MDSIENAENNSVDFKPIKPSYSSFEKLVPRKVEGVSTINLSFPIKKSYLESENAIVLTIDSIEKRIFLITRSE